MVKSYKHYYHREDKLLLLFPNIKDDQLIEKPEKNYNKENM